MIRMPWHVAQSASCPAGKPWGVIKNSDGSAAGCHPTKAAAQKQLAALYANEPGASMSSSAVTSQERAAVDNSAWDGNAAMSACKTAADYRAICAGRKDGPPDQRGTWALPHHKRPGAPPNAGGVRNSLSRLPQTQGLTNKQAAQAHLEAHMRSVSPGHGNSADPGGEYRTIPFELADVEVNGDGLTFSGYAAVFNTVARIDSLFEGEFDEQLAPGSWDRTLAAGYPKLMFEHGRHPLIGTMPLGVLHRADPDTAGVFVEGRLIDNWLIQPVRDAVAAGALDGMSFRFTVDEDGEIWVDRAGDVPLRTLTSVSVPELGPVVFPAYEPTTASVRSVLDKLPVIGQPPAGARAASGRAGDARQDTAAPPNPLSERFRRDGEALALRGIKGVRT